MVQVMGAIVGRRFIRSLAMVVAGCAVGIAVGWTTYTRVVSSKPTATSDCSSAIRYARDYFAFKVLPEAQLSFTHAVANLGTIYAHAAIRPHVEGEPITECRPLIKDLGMTSFISSVSPVVIAPGLCRMETGAAVLGNVVGCYLPVVERMIGENDLVKVWGLPVHSANGATTGNRDLSGAIISARLLIDPSEAVGKTMKVSVHAVGAGGVETRSGVCRIIGVFETEQGLADDVVYVSLPLVQSLLSREDGSCDEIWVWWAHPDDDSSRRSLKSVLESSAAGHFKSREVSGGGPFTVRSLHDRFSKKVSPLAKAIDDARAAVEALSCICGDGTAAGGLPK